MAILDNSGDIILDAVLTDAGRRALARGDGTFKVSYFKLGDDEINYGAFNLNHTGGTPYYDLEILQTPVLEAFTNNEASLNSTLISYTNPRLLYLPQLILNTNVNKNYGTDVGFFQYDPAKNSFIVATTEGTMRAFGNATGVLNGVNPGRKDSRVRLEYGLNAPGKTPGSLRDREPELYDDQFTIEYDSRLCSITDLAGTTIRANFTDENMIATIVVTSQSNLVTQMTQFGSSDDPDQPEMQWLRGPMIEFKIIASNLLQSGDPDSSKSLWQKHGTQDTASDWDTTASTIGSASTCGAPGQANNLDTRAEAGDLWRITSNIRVTSINAGPSVDVPVRFYKSKNFVTRC